MNEFVIKNGFISKGDSIVSGSLSGETLNLTTTPSNDNSQTQVLVRNNATGIIEYRDASSLSGTPGTNTFVTGYTYDNNNTFTIFDSDGGSFPATINQVSGLTVNGTLSATTLYGGTIFSGGTNLLSIIDDRDDFVTGTTFTNNQSILSRNDGTEVLKISGGTNVTITSGGTNLTVIDVTIPLDSNTFVTGFTYDDNNTFTISDNVGDTFPVTINTMTGLTVNGKTITTQLQVTTSPTSGYVLTSDASGNATWQAGGGGGGPTLRNVSSTDTFATANETINCTSGTFIVNLPTAVGIQGTTYTLVNSGTGVITLDANGIETINGSTTIDLSTQYISRTVQSDNTNWIVI